MANTELAAHLESIAQLKQLAGANRFAIIAYQNAAKTVLGSKEINADNVGTLDGIGAKIAKAIVQFLADGSSDAYQELAEQVPVECLTMTRVRGIGPKKAYKLWQEGVKNFDQLVAKAEAGKLDAKLTNSVIFARDTKAGRLPLDEAYPVGKAVLEVINGLDIVEKAELCGSLRRHKDTIKDLDVVVCVKDKKDNAKAFEEIIGALSGAGLLIGEENRGEIKCALLVQKYSTRLGCDIWLVEPHYWGTALNYATGSKFHNEKLRALAVNKGLLVNEYGIWAKRGKGERLGGENETDLYDILELEYVEPQDREQ